MGLTADMKRVVTEPRLGFVATVCPDGTPHLSPKGPTAVWDDDHLVFAHICSPRTTANVSATPAIEVNVVDPIVRMGYRFKGTARVLTEGPLDEEIRAFSRRGPSALQDGVVERIQAIVLVTVEQALPLVSPASDGGASEDEVAARWWRHWETLRKGKEKV